MRSIGLDIGEYSIKIVELSLNKKNIVIHQLQEKVLNPQLTGHDKELEAIEFVRTFIASGDFLQSRWVLAVPQDHVTTRFKTFPFSDRIKIQKSLSFEMEEDIPFDTENCIFDAKLIQTTGLTANVLASVIPKNHIEKIIDLAASFGIQIHILTIEGLAFANLIENWDQPVPAIQETQFEIDQIEKTKKSFQVILNMGHEKTLFTAYEDNRLVFVRSLYWGAHQIVQEIIKKNQITQIEALHILQNQGLVLLNKQGASFEQTQISNTISKSLRELVRDLQMTLLELQSEFNADVVQINFTGGAALLPNLGGFLTQHLEIACNPISLLQNYSNSILNFTSPDQAFTTECRFASAMSFALEGFKKPRNPAINLLKGEFVKQNDRLKVFWQQWGATLQVGLASFVVFVLWASFRDNFSSLLLEKADDAIVTQAKSVARLPKKQANETGVKKYIKENKKKAAELKLVSQVAQMNSALDLLKKVSEATPAKDQIKMDLMTFSVKDDMVQMTGYVNSPKELSLVTQKLETISVGPLVQLNANLAAPPNRVAFNISFKVDRGISK